MADSVEVYEVGRFSAWDYVVVVAMLLISVAIGIFYSLTGGKQKTADEFFLGNRNMNPIPVALSLVASFQSATTVLGTPAEVYLNGSMYGIFVFSLSSWYSLRRSTFQRFTD